MVYKVLFLSLSLSLCNTSRLSGLHECMCVERVSIYMHVSMCVYMYVCMCACVCVCECVPVRVLVTEVPAAISCVSQSVTRATFCRQGDTGSGGLQ